MYFIVYKEYNQVLHQGDKDYIQRIMDNVYYNCKSHYKILTKQQLKELEWEF